jgi:hypothetical protein
VAEVLVDRSKWDMAEHNRMLAALDANGWRRQDTALYPRISRKVFGKKCAHIKFLMKNPKSAKVSNNGPVVIKQKLYKQELHGP